MATIVNGLKLFEYCYFIYLIIKNHYFRQKLKKMLRGIFQKQTNKSDSNLQKYEIDFLELQ